MADIVVSIICNAYNHEKYIRKALEGFIMQKTNFAYEVLIHDDASTDKTADMIREYEIKYPNLIKPIYQVENQYSKGVGVSRTFQWPRVKGKYIAFCEGDDYWIDPLKLQKQYDAMESHPDIDICAHSSIKVEANTEKELCKICPKDCDCIIPAKEVIGGGGGYVATASLLYRTTLLDNHPRFRQFMQFDYTLQIHGSLRGGMLYLSDCMSAYRAMADGSWSVRMRQNIGEAGRHFKKVHQMLMILNEDTDKMYDDVIQKKLSECEFSYHLLNADYKQILSAKYKDLFLQMPKKERIKLRLKACCPVSSVIKRRLSK